MYQLRRFYLDSVGVPAGRFVDFTVDLTDPDGAPTDTIAWLANGGGKSTMLSLLVGHIRPARNEFLATVATGRTLEDLIESSDTTHVAAEWVDATGAVLLTGAVYEWRDRQRPREPDREHARLHRRWWCVRPGDDTVGLDTLPFFTRSGGTTNYQAFCNHISELAAAGVDAVVCTTHTDWHEALRMRRFDPELWSDIAKMNATEGGIDNAFRFDNDNDFARYLLGFIARPGQATDVRALLADTAAQIAKTPGYQADQRFATEAIPLLETLGDTHIRAEQAADAAAGALVEAGQLRAALDAAAADARAVATEQAAAAQRLDDELRETNTATENRRRLHLEYTRLEAELAVAAADQVLADAAAAADAAGAVAAAWDATDDVGRESEAVGELAAARTARDAAAADAQPLLDALNATGRLLAATLGHRLNDTNNQIDTHLAAADAADERREDAQGRWTRANKTQAQLESQRTAANDTVTRHTRDINDARNDGLVGADDTIDAARQRTIDTLARIDAALTTGDQRRTEITAERATVRAARDTAVNAARTARRAADAAEDRAVALHAAADRLGADPDLQRVAASSDLDVLSEASSLATAARDDIATAERRLVDLRSDAAANDRALAALDTDGLLPPSRDVERICAALEEARIVAHPGWQYLARNVPVDDHRRLITQVPHAAGGVVIYGAEPAAAAEHLDELDLDAPVALVTPDVFVDPTAVDAVVIGPVPATHNTAAAAHDAALRREQQTRRSDEIAATAATVTTNQRLVSQLEQLIEDCGPGGFGAIEEAAATTQRAADLADNAVAGHDTHLGALDTEVERLTGDLRRLSDDRGRRAADLVRLDTLAAADERAAGARELLRTIDTKISRTVAEVNDATRDATEAQTDAATHRDQAAQLRRAAGDLNTELASLPDADGVDEEIDDIDGLRAEHRTLAAQFTIAFDSDTLLAAVTAAEQRLARARQALSVHQPAAVDAARDLLAGPDGSTADTRHSAKAHARAALARATEAVGVARTDAEQARTVLAGASPPGGRRRHTTAPITPTTRGEARHLADEAYAEWSASSERASQLDAARRQAVGAAESAASTAQTLVDQSTSIPAEPVEGTVAVPDDLHVVRRRVAEARQRVETTTRDAASAANERTAAARRLTAWAADGRFAGNDGDAPLRRLRDRFIAENVADDVGPHASGFVTELTLRAELIADQLDAIDTHKNNVVRRLASLAADAVSEIVRAGRQSELPEEIGAWGGHQFFKVDVVDNTARSPEVVTARVSALVDTLVGAAGSLPRADELLWRATEAAAGPGGFRATVLKPGRNQSTDRVRVPAMKKWSGGEKVTASLLLYCTFARLRSQARHGNLYAGGGALVMDNPLGKANYVEFLDMQRKVAAANNVQLVFFTGLGDLSAINRFGRIVAMRKQTDLGTGREYVEHNADASTVDVVTVAAGSRVA